MRQRDIGKPPVFGIHEGLVPGASIFFAFRSERVFAQALKQAATGPDGMRFLVDEIEMDDYNLQDILIYCIK